MLDGQRGGGKSDDETARQSKHPDQRWHFKFGCAQARETKVEEMPKNGNKLAGKRRAEKMSEKSNLPTAVEQGAGSQQEEPRSIGEACQRPRKATPRQQ
jgi:hypothetical protein